MRTQKLVLFLEHAQVGHANNISAKDVSCKQNVQIIFARLLSDGEINMDALLEVPLPTPKDREFVESLQVSQDTKRLILEGVPKPQRSEAGMKVILALLGAGHVEDIVWFILNNYAIGEKYREKGTARAKWLRGEITRARGHLATEQNTSGRQGNAQPEQPEIEEIVQELNQEHAVIMMSGKCMIMNEIYDQQFERPDITFSRPSDIKLYYANQKVLILEGGSHRLVNKAKIWLEAPNRREYQGVIFDPQGDIPGYYNLFRGLAVESKQGDWSLFRRHIMEVIANGDEAITKYILAWMAHLVQQPGGERPGTALVLRGKQGTGKGCFVAQFGKIFGSHFIHVSSQRQITGRFNGHLKDALLVFCDEGIWAGDKTSEGVLKAMITEDRNLIEPKGKEVYSVKNHMRLIVASNNDWVIPAGFEERRFCVLDISDKYMQDRDYFRSIFEQMDNGGREAMLYDLLHYDISGIDLKTFPRTQALMDQIFSSMTPVQKFWYERLNEGSLIEHHDEWKSFIPIEELYGEYIQFAENIGGRYQVTSTKFGKEIRKLCPQVIKKKMKANHSGDGRKSHYHFPTLIECRKSFEKLVKMELQWDLET